MKFTVSALFLSVASVVVAEDDIAPHRELYGYEDACIKSHKITLENGICNYDAIAEVLQESFNSDPACKEGTNVANELRALFMNEALSLDQVADLVNSACEDAFYQLMYADGVGYIDILDDSQQMVKEYFDGRGAVNSDKEYESARGLGETILTQIPIQWPGDRCFDYKKSIPSNIQSQFPREYFKNKAPRASKLTGRYTTDYKGRRTSQRSYTPVENFDQCKLNTAMCCWTESTDTTKLFGEARKIGEELDHNTDLCFVNMADAPTSSRVTYGFAIFVATPEVAEGQGSVRCHGFNWAEDPMHVSNLFKGNALFQASFHHHMNRGGYVSPISGAPMCGCLEQMPIVTKADCTEIEVGDFNVEVEISKGRIEVKIPESNKIAFKPCTADPEPEPESEEEPATPDEERKLQETNSTDAPPAAVTEAAIEAATDAATEPVTEPDTEPVEKPANVIDLRTHYELMVKKNMIPDKSKDVAQRLVGEGGCAEYVSNYFNDNGIHAYNRRLVGN